MHRNDLDRYLDNKEDYKKAEILSEDKKRTKVNGNPIAKLAALLLIGLVFYIVFLVAK